MREIEKLRWEHRNTVVVVGEAFQALCTCGWLSTINELEHVALLRAMHAHAVVTFGAYA